MFCYFQYNFLINIVKINLCVSALIMLHIVCIYTHKFNRYIYNLNYLHIQENNSLSHFNKLEY